MCCARLARAACRVGALLQRQGSKRGGTGARGWGEQAAGVEGGGVDANAAHGATAAALIVLTVGDLAGAPRLAVDYGARTAAAAVAGLVTLAGPARGPRPVCMSSLANLASICVQSEAVAAAAAASVGGEDPSRLDDHGGCLQE
jgi:hypothetical protein